MNEVLTHAAVFRGLQPAELEELDAYCTPLTFISGDEIFTRDRFDSHDLFLLYGGHIEMLGADDQPVEHVLSAEEPELVGEVAWLTGRERTLSLRCLADVEALQIDGDALAAWVEANPRGGIEVMRNLARQLVGRLVEKEQLLGLMNRVEGQPG